MPDTYLVCFFFFFFTFDFTFDAALPFPDFFAAFFFFAFFAVFPPAPRFVAAVAFLAVGFLPTVAADLLEDFLLLRVVFLFLRIVCLRLPLVDFLLLVVTSINFFSTSCFS